MPKHVAQESHSSFNHASEAHGSDYARAAADAASKMFNDCHASDWRQFSVTARHVVPKAITGGVLGSVLGGGAGALLGGFAGAAVGRDEAQEQLINDYWKCLNAHTSRQLQSLYPPTSNEGK